MSPRSRKTVSEQLSGAELGDARRTKRLVRMAEALSQRPGASLPEAMGDDAALEGAYRFLNNEEVEPEVILGEHVAETVRQLEAVPVAYAVSDTTELRFGGKSRRGLGPLLHEGLGFLSHPCLVVAGDGSRLPLGLLAHKTWVRPPEKKGRRGTQASRRAPDRESLKWEEVTSAAAKAAGSQAAKLIHVMDREADIYGLFASLQKAGQHFIIRVAQNRALEDETGRVFAALERAPAQVLREVPLSRRVRQSKSHPSRKERKATLSISACELTLRRPEPAETNLPPSLRLNFVHVFEANPPPGEVAVDWKLVTSRPVTTLSEQEQVVDGYRTRWVIEELFKALKTGCGIEASELESAEALLTLLAIKLPIAVQLLALRSLAESEAPARGASRVFTPLRLEVLRAMSKVPLGPDPTASEVMWAVAALGGHIKNNGSPGWQVLGRGFQDLLRYETAWAVFKVAPRM
jgi:hypothetical protein